MKTYARLNTDNIVQELFTCEDITGLFHPSFVWVEAGPDVREGMQYDDRAKTFAAVSPAKADALAQLNASDGDASRFGEDALRCLIMSGQFTPNAQLAQKLADRDYLRAIIRGDVKTS